MSRRVTRCSDARSSIGLTQSEFANLLGVHAMTVSRWERGQATPSRYQQETLDAIVVGASSLEGTKLAQFEHYLGSRRYVYALARLVLPL